MKKRIDITCPTVEGLIQALKQFPEDALLLDTDCGHDTGIALESETLDTIDDSGNPDTVTVVNLYIYNTSPYY